jgi:segregation and condensation protein A
MIEIKLEQFEGPLALLVKLIDKAELDITQVSLAKVADQYVAHLKSLTYLDPEAMADFLVVASRLLLIKSKALLPYLLPEEEEAIEDFEEQLRMYKEFLEATKKIETMVAGKKFMFVREFNRKAIVNNLHLFAPPAKLTPKEMKTIFLGVIENLRPESAPLPEQTIQAAVSIEEKIAFITKTIRLAIKTRFSQLFSSAASKVEIVVSFLAMLELMKQRNITAEQGELFSEIDIIKIN